MRSRSNHSSPDAHAESAIAMELHVASIAVSSQGTAILTPNAASDALAMSEVRRKKQATQTKTPLQDKLISRFMEELQLQRATIRTRDAIENSHSTPQWAISLPVQQLRE